MVSQVLLKLLLIYFCVFSSFSLDPLELNTCSDRCPLVCIFNISSLIDGDLVSDTWVLLKGKSRYLFFPSKAILNVVLFQQVLSAVFSMDMAIS